MKIDKKIINKLGLIEDKKAKSKTFFFKKKRKNIIFNKKHINFLKNYNLKTKSDIRICLHKNIQSIDQNMILIQNKNNFYPPHKHLLCGDTYHIIEGKLLVCFFSKSGKIIEKNILSKNQIFKTPPKVYHSTKPLTKSVIFHESRAGKFIRGKSSVFPAWCPKTEVEKKIFNKKLLNEKI